MRLFIALELPQKIKDNLYRSAKQLSEYAVKGNFVAPENYHLTLHFLGETDENDLIYIQSAMDSVRNMPSPELSACQITTLRSAEIVCAKYRYDKKLTELHEALGLKLEQSGFTVEHRAFRPHTTLIRKYAFSLPFSEVTKNVTVYNMPYESDLVCLYESYVKDGSIAYRELYSVNLNIGACSR